MPDAALADIVSCVLMTGQQPEERTLVGNSVTLADHTVASWLIHAEMAGLPLDGFTEVKRWSGGILGSAAWQKALATIPGA